VNQAVKISVAGQPLAVRTSASPAYLRELADFVTARIEEVRAPGRTVTTQSLALLAALNIADELYQLRDDHAQLKRQVRERLERILRYLDKEAEFLT
jgi:cell division protein ZapA